MSDRSFAESLEERSPAVPAGFAPFVVAAAGGVGGDPRSLARAARAALERGAGPEAGPHRGAFDLLAADGLATSACEAALDADDPDAVLAEVLAILVG